MPLKACTQAHESLPKETATLCSAWGINSDRMLTDLFPEQPVTTACLLSHQQDTHDVTSQSQSSADRSDGLREQVATTTTKCALPERQQALAQQQQQSPPSAPCCFEPATDGPTLKGLKAPRLRWTSDLHELFMRCVDQLGGIERTTPKQILKSMQQQSRGLRALTILHVKSHLQKLRTCGRGSRQDGEAQPRTPTLQALDLNSNSDSNADACRLGLVGAPGCRAPLPQPVPTIMLDSGGSETSGFWGWGGCTSGPAHADAGDLLSPVLCGPAATPAPCFHQPLPALQMPLTINQPLMTQFLSSSSLLSSASVEGTSLGGTSEHSSFPSPTDPAVLSCTGEAPWARNAHTHHSHLASCHVSAGIHLGLMGSGQGGREGGPAVPSPPSATGRPCPQDWSLVDEWDMPAKACAAGTPDHLGPLPGQASLQAPLASRHPSLQAVGSAPGPLPGPAVGWGALLQSQPPGLIPRGTEGSRGASESHSMWNCFGADPDPALGLAPVPGFSLGLGPSSAPGIGLGSAVALSLPERPATLCTTLGAPAGLSDGTQLGGGLHGLAGRKRQLSRVASFNRRNRLRQAEMDARLGHAIMQHEELQQHLQHQQAYLCRQRQEATHANGTMAPAQQGTALPQRRQSIDPVLSSFLDFSSDNGNANDIDMDWR